MGNLTKLITLIEFDYHAEVLLNTLRVFSALPIRINLFSTKNIWKKINLPSNENINVFLSDNKKDAQKLISENIDVINQSHIIFFNTLASNFRYFSSIDFIPPVILRIHNANAYLDPWKSINPKLSVFYIWKDISYLFLLGILKMELWYRPKFIKTKVDFFLFPSEAIKDHVLKCGYVKSEKILPPIPYVFMSPILKNNPNEEEVQITIIGAIDKRRRNYNEVYYAFKKLAPKFTRKVKLNLLGKPSGFIGKRIIQKFNSLESDNFKVKSFNKFVPQEEFDRITSISDFLIIPTVRETRYKIFKELYGFTKISGNMNDVIIYRKPALLPSFYPVEEPLTSHFEKYSTKEELVSLLYKWVEGRDFVSYSFNSKINKYEYESVVKTADIVISQLTK